MRLEHLLSGAVIPYFRGLMETGRMDCRLLSVAGNTRSDGNVRTEHGGLAQLARAPVLQAGGQRFESVILHSEEHNDILEASSDSKNLDKARTKSRNTEEFHKTSNHKAKTYRTQVTVY